MKEIALEFLKIINSKGYKAYIVGGFVRDYLMQIESHDIDINTNATPKEIKKIFSNIKFSKNINEENSYGAVSVIYKNILFEVTTFREEEAYLDNRHPSSIRYINDLETDLQRRDFTINAICMDQDGKIIDPLNGQIDLSNRIIKTIINPSKSFKDDALRILRSIRFATNLNFSLDSNLKLAIKETKKYLKNISYDRKKRELDKIFASIHAKEGINLLKELDLLEFLDLENINRVKDYSDLIGIWSMINSRVYPFTKNEKELIKNINFVYELDNLNPLVLYKYGLYVNTIAGINKGLSKPEINKAYQELPIKVRSDINITAKEICEIFNKEPSSFLNDVFKQLEIEILTGNLQNVNSILKEYILNHFPNL